MLDRLTWLSGEVIRKSSCPKCDPDKVDFGPERILSPFIEHISPKLIDTSPLKLHTARNIVRNISHLLDEGARNLTEGRKRKAPSFIVFVDQK